jgi:hypothetical protein
MNLKKVQLFWWRMQNVCITVMTTATEKNMAIKIQSTWLPYLKRHISHEDKR